MAINSNFRTLTADNIEGVVAPRNYLKNSFENGTTAGWTEMAVTLTSGLPTGTPTISSTAAASIALTNTTTTPLSLSRSLLVTGAAGWTAGQGFISDEFTIDRMDGGKPLTVSFDYERVSGTLNFSGTLGSQTLMVYIYDATAGAANWIQPAGFLGINQSSGPGRVTATFQSSVVAGQKYRVAVIASQAVGSACSLEFDNFTCSRVTAPIGPVVTDWVSYTPTWSSSGTQPGIGNGTISGKWRRVGDSIECDIGMTFGVTSSPGTGTWYWSIPSGLTFDLSKVSSQYTEGSIGTATIVDAGVQNYGPYNVCTASTSTVAIRLGNVSATWLTSASQAAPGNPVAVGAGDLIGIHFSFPIQGWSSSVQMSSDTDTRVVAASVSNSTSSLAITLVDQVIPFNLVAVDTHGAYSTGTNYYTFPVSGIYSVSANILYNITGFTGGSAIDTSISLVGAGSLQRTRIYIGGSTFISGVATYTGFFAAGQQINIVTSRVNNGITANVHPDSGFTRFSVNRLSGPSVIAASEVVEATYQSTSGNSMTNGTEMFLDFPTKIRDTHGAVSGTGTGNKIVSNAGWKFTAPITGRYYVNAVFHVTSGAVANSVTYGYIAVNGAAKSHSDIKAGQNPAGDAFGSQINGEVFMNAGDYLEIVGYQANGANRNQQAVGIRNQVEIVRVGAY